MTHTLLASQTREVVIGFDKPFVMIGERINPTGRKLFSAELKERNYWRVKKEALEQVAAGAQVLDVNVGVPLADESGIMAEVIPLIQSLTDVPLCIDSSIIETLESGLKAYKGRALVNSTTAEEDVMQRVLPLVAKYDAAVVAISNDDTGISEDPDVRFEVAKQIVNRAADYNIKAQDVVVDPLVMPIGAVNSAGLDVFRLIHRLRTELGVNTTCGASNIAFGLPNRHVINNAFLPMLACTGMTSAIVNPLHEGLVPTVRAADLLNGVDPGCANWIKAYRPTTGVETSRRRSGRERRRAAVDNT